MTQVAIVGGGEVGGLLAHALARRNIAPDICLIDDNGRAALGKALDIMQAAPVEGFSSNLSGAAELSAIAGASVVAIADAFGGQQPSPDASMLLLKRVRDLSPASLIVCVGAGDRDLIDRGVRELHIPRAQLFGSAPEALAGGIRALTAIELDAPASDVALSVLGVPPNHIIVPWDDATVGGFSLVRVLSEPARRRLDARLAGLWPPGPYALASRCGQSHRHDLSRIAPAGHLLCRAGRFGGDARTGGRPSGAARTLRSDRGGDARAERPGTRAP